MATKDKKDKKSEFPSSGGSGVSREVGQKFKHCKNAEIPRFGSAFGRTKLPGQKLDNNSIFLNLRP